MLASPTARVAPISHDRLFKRLFKDFFPHLLELFCPTWARRITLEGAQFLDKELLSPDPGGPPQDDDTEADLAVLVHRLPSTPSLPGLEGPRDEPARLLVHAEIQEGASPIPIGRRIFEYNHGLGRAHGCPVISLLIWFGSGRGGIEEEIYQEAPLEEQEWTLRFRYRRVGVRGLRAQDHLNGTNPLGYALAARMDRGPLSRAELRAACENRIAAAPLSAEQRFWLINCVRTYLVLSIEEEKAYRALRQRPEYQEIGKMELTWDEQMWQDAEQRGELRGEHREARRSLVEFWEARFGPMPSEMKAKIDRIHDADKLRRMRLALYRAQTQEEALLALTG